MFNFCDFINDAIRIMIILQCSKSRTSLKMDNNKITQFDYYLKFPYTMLEEKAEPYGFIENIDEYYAFFHWQPNVIQYRQVINYLIAKGFIVKDNDSFYQITDIGTEALNKIDNKYYSKLSEFCLKAVIPTIYNWSNKKIEQDIKTKANIITLRGIIKNDKHQIG